MIFTKYVINVYMMTCKYLQARHDHYHVVHALLSMLCAYGTLIVLSHSLLSLIFVYVDINVVNAYALA